MAAGPCLNPNCKSNGAPHPNCRCYGAAMAEGGEVSDFCSTKGIHKNDCEYFAEGGDVALPAFEATVDVPPTQGSSSATTLPKFEDTQEVKLPAFEDTQEKPDYDTVGQNALAGAEGVAKGFLGPVATGLELGAHKLGIDKAIGIDTSAEAQKGREEASPILHGVGEVAGLGTGLLTGTGEAGLIAKGAEHFVPEALGKVGAGAIKGFIENAAIQGGDEISKAMLGQGDPEAPVSSYLAHVGMAGIMGGVTGGAFGALGKSASKGLESLENKKMGAKAQSFLAGFGDASRDVAPITEGAEKVAFDPISKFKNNVEKAKLVKSYGISDMDSAMYRKGLDAHAAIENALHGNITKRVVDIGATAAGGAMAGPVGVAITTALTPIVEKIVDKGINKANSYVYPAIMKVLSSGETRGIWNALDYTNKMSQGAKKISNTVGSLFGEGAQQSYNGGLEADDREKLRKFIDDGGMEKQIQNSNQAPEAPAYAEGGQVKPIEPEQPNTLATHFPNQSMAIDTAKSRIYSYLSGIKPQPQNGLPFDVDHKNHAKENSYNRALDIANKPLSVLDHVHAGTILPEHISHLNAMYPEVKSHLVKKITEKMIESKSKGHVPSYRVRQGLTMLMGSPMDTTFTQQAIAAAQPQPNPQPPVDTNGKMKGGKATAASMNKQAKSYQTASQAGENDRATRK